MRMKTVLSIPLIVLILFTGINVSFSVHYCSGSVFATKISLKGETATCGMENPSISTSFQDIFKNKCCDDVTSALSICNNYVPSTHFISDPEHTPIQEYSIPADLSPDQYNIDISAPVNTRPPGSFDNYRFSQAILCIFRI
jgi:hypothetical protein